MIPSKRSLHLVQARKNLRAKKNPAADLPRYGFPDSFHSHLYVFEIPTDKGQLLF